ncbi:MFS transporter [Palaeococcus ferrophilus]|uniref:MFS transporter n=1 Tax=Palaeococcus ferrophilus TaxID=83868 RepID=UPI00064FB3E4|nr:MFS transporter [Palaeococcus ferrophilus]
MRRRLLIVLSLGWIFNYVHRMIVPPLIPLIKVEFGINNAQAGLLMTSLLLPYALIQVPAGYLGDRFGRKRVLVMSILGYSLSSALMLFGRNYWHVIGFRALYGLFAGLYYAPATALISEVYGRKKGSALGLFMVGPPVGSGLAPLIALPVALSLGWRWAFVVTSIASALIGLALLFGVRCDTKRGEKAKATIPRHLLPLGVANFAILAAFFATLTFLPDFFVSMGRSVEEASLYFSALSIAGIAGSLGGGALYDRLGRKSTEMAIGLTALLILLLTVSTLPQVVPILGVFFYAIGPIVTAYTAELATDENRGSVMGFVNMAGFFGATVGPYSLGLLIDAFGYKMAFLALPALYLLALGIIMKEKR